MLPDVPRLGHGLCHPGNQVGGACEIVDVANVVGLAKLVWGGERELLSM